MPVRSIKNQYRGINAHFHSYFQSEGGWNSFHSRQIIEMANALNEQLVSMGYFAEVQESLQIRRVGDVPRRPESDLLVYDRDPLRSSKTNREPHLAADWLPVRELLPDDELSEHPFNSIVVLPIVRDSWERGEPVVWIELLSPTNKGIGSDADTYRTKRLNMLRNGLVFVEIDYLHETPPTFSSLPLYRPVKGQQVSANAHPYWIVVIDPRPNLDEGQAWVKGFNVDEPAPILAIPLNADDLIQVDFNAAYQQAFKTGYLGIRGDYADLPLNFERYSPDDQGRIAARMVAVLEAARDGVDLESGPFPVKDDLTLEDALARITALKEIGT